MSSVPFNRLSYVVVPYEVESEEFGRFVLYYYSENPVSDFAVRQNGSTRRLDFVVYGNVSLQTARKKIEQFLSDARSEFNAGRRIYRLLRMYLSSVRPSLDLDIPFVEEV